MNEIDFYIYSSHIEKHLIRSEKQFFELLKYEGAEKLESLLNIKFTDESLFKGLPYRTSASTDIEKIDRKNYIRLDFCYVPESYPSIVYLQLRIDNTGYAPPTLISLYYVPTTLLESLWFYCRKYISAFLNTFHLRWI